MIYQTNFGGGSAPRSPFSSLISLVIFAGFAALMFFVVKGFVKLLYLVAPLLLVVALVLNHNVVLEYLRDLWEGLKRDVLWGVMKVVLSIVFYPFVFLWLLVKILLVRKLVKMTKNFGAQGNPFEAKQGFGNEEIYTEYEEVKDDDPKLLK